jgi:hypothetical protein
MRNWHEEGVKAGKTDGWMNLEETLSEDLERHPQYARNVEELVQAGIEGWEETDHFSILYGSKMMDDAQEALEADSVNDEVIEKYQDNKDAFWEGYLSGRKSIGKDIYKVAQKLIAQKNKPAGKPKPKTKNKTKSRKGAKDTGTQLRMMR